jgi:hypothetical protein
LVQAVGIVDRARAVASCVDDFESGPPRQARKTEWLIDGDKNKKIGMPRLRQNSESFFVYTGLEKFFEDLAWRFTGGWINVRA